MAATAAPLRVATHTPRAAAVATTIPAPTRAPRWRSSAASATNSTGRSKHKRPRSRHRWGAVGDERQRLRTLVPRRFQLAVVHRLRGQLFPPALEARLAGPRRLLGLRGRALHRDVRLPAD